MRLTDLLSPDAIIPSLKATNKKQVLQELSDRAARISGLSAREVFDALLQRERLGSTGIGEGVAIPHGKLSKIKRIFGVFARLERPIDFEALDGAPVDLVFLLLAPEASGADHLKALACAARMLRDANAVSMVRATRDSHALYSLIAQGAAKPHAA
jgi:PTS system nitrogen regulatory IIA component